MSLDPRNLYGEVTLLSLLSTEEIPLPKAIGTASHLNELKVCKCIYIRTYAITTLASVFVRMYCFEYKPQTVYYKQYSQLFIQS